MRKLIMVPLAVAVLAIVASAPAVSHATKTVSITRSAFVPNTVSILTGDSVTWTNSDTVNHQVISQSAGFASPVLKPGETFTHTYLATGKFGYKDALSTKTGNGSVTVANAPVNYTLSLASSATTITYGVGSVTLAGKLAPAKAGQQVTLNAQPLSDASAKALETTTTDASGAYSFTVSPSIHTTYSSVWQSGSDKAASPAVSVNVRPRVGLGLRSHRGVRFTYLARVTADLSYQGRVVLVQRYVPAVGAWTTLKRAFLSSTSRAIFTLKLRPRVSKLRVYLPASQAGVGYTWGVSRSVLAIR